MIRDWLVFGSPLPGQAVANAFSVTGLDIFAWNDPPTLSRYLARRARPARSRCASRASWHNFFMVLLLPGVPISVIGLAALPWQARGAALRPVVLLSVITFLVTSLLFPVATTWGTFLHAAGPVHVLIDRRRLLALDAGIARLGGGWAGPDRSPGSGRRSVIFGRCSSRPRCCRRSAQRPRDGGPVRELARRMAAVGRPLDATPGPVITNFPIWLAETQRIPSLALPDEPPADVLDLARRFPGHPPARPRRRRAGHWPADLATRTRPARTASSPSTSAPAEPAGRTRSPTRVVFEIVCP